MFYLLNSVYILSAPIAINGIMGSEKANEHIRGRPFTGRIAPQDSIF